MSKPTDSTPAVSKEAAGLSTKTTDLIPCVCKHCDHAFDVAKRPPKCPACGVKAWWIPPVTDLGRVPEVFWDAGTKSGGYIIRAGERFIQLGTADLKIHLKRAGVPQMPGVGTLTREEHVLWSAQSERQADYVGQIAGMKLGFHKLRSGNAVICTQGPRIIAGKKGEFDGIGEGLASLLAPDKKQFHTFVAWLARARRALVAGKVHPTQVLLLAGQGGCGKGWLQEIVTRCLGGRAAKPHAYFTGGKHNGELLEAEHWYGADEELASIATLRTVGAHFKQTSTAEPVYFNPKGRKALNMGSYRVLTYTFNEEPEIVKGSVPPMDDSLADKVHLMRADFATLPGSREEIEDLLDRELPAFCYFLDHHKPDKRMLKSGWCACSTCGGLNAAAMVLRFGMMPFHEPQLLASLRMQQPESQLWELVSQAFADKEARSVRMSSEDVQSELMGSRYANEAASLANRFTGAIATYLGRLAKLGDGRVGKVVNEGKTFWVLAIPGKGGGE